MRVDHLARLGAQRLLDDRPEAPVAEQRLEDQVLVGVDGALHHRLAQSPGGTDHGDAGEAGADGAVGEQRGIAATTGVQQIALTAHVEEGLLLAGKAGFGKVLAVALERTATAASACPLRRDSSR